MPARGIIKGGAEKARANHAGKDQHYATPISLAVAALKYLKNNYLYDMDCPTIVDAGMGNWGVFGYAAKHVWKNNCYVIGVDIRDVPKWDWYDEALTGQSFWDEPKPRINHEIDITVGNPPFSQGEQFAREGLNIGKYTFQLLPLAFLEAKRRDDFFNSYGGLVFPLVKRPSWWQYDDAPEDRKGSKTTNSRAYAFFLWQRNMNLKSWARNLTWDYNPILETQFKIDTGQQVSYNFEFITGEKNDNQRMA